MVVNQDELCGEQLQRPFHDQPMVDDRSRHTPLTDPLAFDDPVRRGEIDHPALLVGQPFEPGPEQADHIVARRHEIRFRSSGHRHATPEFRRRQQQSGPFQPQSADHPQPGFGFGSQSGQRAAACLPKHPGQRLVLDQQRQQLPVVECFDAPGGHFITDILHGFR